MIKKLRMIKEYSVAVVTATSDFDPLNRLKDISFELEKKEFKGDVVFDLMCVNGLSSNRFVKLLFNGHVFERKSFLVLENIDENIKEEQDEVFRKNPDFLKSSVLSSAELKSFMSH